MKNEENPKKISLLKQSVAILALLVLLGVNVVIYFSRSFAWFANNENVEANSTTVNLAEFGISDAYFFKGVGADDYTEISSWDLVFQNMNPGESVSIKGQYTNNSDKTHTLSLYFGLFDGSTETPLVKDGKYYYLSTQLKITDVVVNGVAQSVSDEKYLMSPPADKIAYDTEQTVQNVFIAEIPLFSGESATAEITVQFVNYSNVNQNDYQGFGQGEENCFRQLTAFIDA
ncbi:MAG: hypothetical protein ACI4ST_07910 [Candidatus Gallimonas sp.]